MSDLGSNFTDEICPARIGMITVKDSSDVNRKDIAFLKDPRLLRNTVYDLVVY